MMTPMAVLGEFLGFLIGSITKNEVWLVMHVIGALIIILPMIITFFPIVINYEKDDQDEVKEPNKGIQANISSQDSTAHPINETLEEEINDDHTNIKNLYGKSVLNSYSVFVSQFVYSCLGLLVDTHGIS
uniref:Uncharacterized protein n=1 Tax=Acrobeloides nanus TaxID=290746 RepID=A0A914D6X1_9BILA